MWEPGPNEFSDTYTEALSLEQKPLRISTSVTKENGTVGMEPKARKTLH